MYNASREEVWRTAEDRNQGDGDMKFIYEHDEEEDFVEVHLTEKELKGLLHDEPVTGSVPACLHTKRSTNVFIRRGLNAINQEFEQEEYREERQGTRGIGASKKSSSGNSARCSAQGRG